MKHVLVKLRHEDFLTLSEEIVYDTGLSYMDLGIWITLLAWPAGVYPSRRILAKRVGVSQQNVKLGLKRLADKNIIHMLNVTLAGVPYCFLVVCDREKSFEQVKRFFARPGPFPSSASLAGNGRAEAGNLCGPVIVSVKGMAVSSPGKQQQQNK